LEAQPAPQQGEDLRVVVDDQHAGGGSHCPDLLRSVFRARCYASSPMSSITAFFPCYGDAGTIASMVVLAERTLARVTDDWEIVVVDDASPDHAAEVLAELVSRYPRLRVVSHPVNRGYGGALLSGFESATKELIFYTDGDAQYDPR